MNYSYEKDYAPRAEDGRCTTSLSGFMEYLRRHKPLLSLPEELTEESFFVWKSAVRAKLAELFAMPDMGKGPAPKLLSSVKREGYRTEKWEFYPFDGMAVSVLVLIPDSASAENPTPLVFCFPGAIHSKEFVAGEELLDKPAARFEKYPERNRMGKYYAESGMIAVVLDPVSVGELAPYNDDYGDHGIRARNEMIYGLMEYGISFPALSVMQAQCFLDFVKTWDIVDGGRIALSGHSLGTETLLPMALIRDDIKAVVFNDLLCDQRTRFVSVTETDDTFGARGSDWAHVMPGKFRYFTYPDLCAALAPMPLSLNEGGAKEDLDKVRRAYEAVNAGDKLQISHYPKYAQVEERPHENETVPDHGLTPEEYFRYTCTDAPDHSFRREPSLKLLKKCFGLN